MTPWAPRHARNETTRPSRPPQRPASIQITLRDDKRAQQPDQARNADLSVATPDGRPLPGSQTRLQDLRWWVALQHSAWEQLSTTLALRMHPNHQQHPLLLRMHCDLVHAARLAAPRRQTVPRIAAYLQGEAAGAADVDVTKAFKRLQNGSDVRGVALSSESHQHHKTKGSRRLARLPCCSGATLTHWPAPLTTAAIKVAQALEQHGSKPRAPVALMLTLQLLLLLLMVVAAAKPDEAVTLTPAAAFFITAAFVDFLRDKGIKDVKVSRLAPRSLHRVAST